MPTITITLSNKSFQLVCDEGSEALLENLVQSLNNKMSEVKVANPSASFELQLVLLALGLAELLNNSEHQVQLLSRKKNENTCELFADTFNDVARYVEQLTRKIQDHL